MWWNGASDGPWVSGSDAVFGGAAGVVALGSPITAHNLSFNSSGYTISGNTLTLTGGTMMCRVGKCHARLGHRRQRGPDPNRLRAADAYRPERLCRPNNHQRGHCEARRPRKFRVDKRFWRQRNWLDDQSEFGRIHEHGDFQQRAHAQRRRRQRGPQRVLRLAHSRRSLYREFCVQGRRHGRWRRLHAAKRQSQCLGWLRRRALGYGTANGGTPITPARGWR